MDNNYLNSNLLKTISELNPLCLIHNLPISAVCNRDDCLKKGGICINCLLESHFENHNKVDIRPLNEFLVSLDEYLLDFKGYNSDMLELGADLLDILGDYRNNINNQIDTLKAKISDYLIIYENHAKSGAALMELLSSELSKNDKEQNNVINKLIDKLKGLQISYENKTNKFSYQSSEIEKRKLSAILDLNVFSKQLQETNENMIKRLQRNIIPDYSTVFKNFNGEPEVIKITLTPEGTYIKKISTKVGTYLIISEEYLSWEKITQWKIKPIELPNRWLGIGIFPKSKFVREVWNSNELIGLNCDSYLIDRGDNPMAEQYKATTESIITFIFNGPKRTLTIEKTNPYMVYTAVSLDINEKYCLSIFFHYPGSEVLLYN